MDSLKAFFREKGLYLICLGLVLAATVTSIWAIRNVVRGVEELDNATQEGTTWNQPDAAVNNPASGVPQSTPKPSEAPSASSSSSGASSQSAAVQGGSGGSAVSSAPSASSFTAPVDGEIALAFSGDDLVYSRTLGDWRTHNGVDYACEEGEDILCPVSGTVESLAAEGNWGVVASIRDAEGRLWRIAAVEDPAVRQGEQVTSGQRLGRAGSITGESAQDPHIHLEVLDQDQYLDPVKLIGS